MEERDFELEREIIGNTYAAFPDSNDRSAEVIYAANLTDGRYFWINGPQVKKFIEEGRVVMNGKCRLRDGTISNIQIFTDTNGDNIRAESDLKGIVPPDEMSDAVFDERIDQAELIGVPKKIMESIGTLADKFLEQIKPIVDFRTKERTRIITAVSSTSSPTQESQE